MLSKTADALDRIADGVEWIFARLGDGLRIFGDAVVALLYFVGTLAAIVISALVSLAVAVWLLRWAFGVIFG